MPKNEENEDDDFKVLKIFFLKQNNTYSYKKKKKFVNCGCV